MEGIVEWISRLRDTDKCIIVEGRNDKRCLEWLGVKARIYLVNIPVFELVEEVSSSCKEVIILTDLDKAGKSLYSELKRFLSEHGVLVDNYFREFLFKETALSQMEGLRGFLDKERQKDKDLEKYLYGIGL